MSKNILVVTGSARREGNSITLANAFIEGARSTGNAVRRYDTATKHMYPIREISNVWLEGKPRELDDDFKTLAPYLNVSDVLVIATPIYFGGICASLKLFIDKLYLYLVSNPRRKLRLTKAILLVTASETGDEAFIGVKHEFSQICKYLDIKEREIVAVPGVRRIGDITNSESLNVAHELGAKIE